MKIKTALMMRAPRMPRKKNLMLEEKGNVKVKEDQPEDEDVIHTQRLIYRYPKPLATFSKTVDR